MYVLVVAGDDDNDDDEDDDDVVGSNDGGGGCADVAADAVDHCIEWLPTKCATPNLTLNSADDTIW